MTSSLEMMYNMGLKNQAAYNLPQQMQSDQQMAAAKLREQQLANEQASTMNPLNAQFRQGQINEQQAQLPGLQGQSRSLAAQGQYDTSMLSSKVAAGISKNAAQIGDDGMKKLGRSGEIALKVAQALPNYPPALHKEVAQKMFQAYGGDPEVLQGILQMPDAAVAKGLGVMGQGMAMASSDYMQKKSLNDDDNRSKERIGAGNNAATVKAAQIAADSRLAAAQARASAVKHMTSDQAFTFLSSIPPEERTPAEQQQIEAISAQRLAEKTAAAPAVAPQVMGQATPQQTAAATAHAITNPNGGKPAAKTVTRTGKTSDGRKVIQYSDGSMEYAN